MFFISFSRCFLAHRRTKSLTIRFRRRTKRSNLSYFWQWLLAFYVGTSQVWRNITKQKRTRRKPPKQQQLAGERTIAASMSSLTAGEHVKRKIKQLCLRLNVVKCGRRTFPAVFMRRRKTFFSFLSPNCAFQLSFFELNDIYNGFYTGGRNLSYSLTRMVLGLASTVGRKITLLGTIFRQKQKRTPEINSSVNTTYELALFHLLCHATWRQHDTFCYSWKYTNTSTMRPRLSVAQLLKQDPKKSRYSQVLIIQSFRLSAFACLVPFFHEQG